MILEHTESRVYGIVPQTAQGLQNLTAATTETSPLRSSLAWGRWEHRSVPSAQRHSLSTGFQSRVQSTHTPSGLGEGLSSSGYLQRAALQHHLLEKTFWDLQQEPPSLRGASQQGAKGKTQGLGSIREVGSRRRCTLCWAGGELFLSTGLWGKMWLWYPSAMVPTTAQPLCNPRGASFK